MLMPIPPRTLRCANAAVYGVVCICLIAANTYAWCAGQLGTVTLGILSAASAGVSLWGVCFAMLRVHFGTHEISFSGLLRRRRWAWSALEKAELRQEDRQNILSCDIRLHFRGGDILEIGTSLFSVDDILQLRDDLAAAGLLSTEQ